MTYIFVFLFVFQNGCSYEIFDDITNKNDSGLSQHVNIFSFEADVSGFVRIL